MGCGSSQIKTEPVSGVVSFNGTPLTTGTVTFVPESGTANDAPQSLGSIGEDGAYKLGTGIAEGAPPGSYKVDVTSSVPSDPTDPYSLPKSVIPAKYASSDTTDLRVEVIKSPGAGAYDLKLTGPS